MWILTNKILESVSQKTLRKSFGTYYWYTDEHGFSGDNETNKWHYEGNIHPRNSSLEKLKYLTIYELLDNLYNKYNDKFIQYIKGNFIIILLKNDTFKLYSDRFGIKKFFHWQDGQDFIISNDLNVITSQIKAIPSAESMAIYALTYHFTGATTLFKNIKHNKPAECIEFVNTELRLFTYWTPEKLLKQPKKNTGIKDISNTLINVVQSYIGQLNSKKISLSLTGGADTRNLLAVFLSEGINPHLYTYGNPLSADCVKASKISSGLNLDHVIHDIKMDEDLFERVARKIIKLSGGLASIHRAHRLMAVEREKQYADQMFLGTLGGEFIKGVSEDDYIVPGLVYNNWNNHIELNILKQYCNDKRLIIDDNILNEVLSFLRKEPYLDGPLIHRKHHALSHITAHLHDAQDVNLYSSVLDRVFTPFLDIDYLEVLFSSHYTFDLKEQISSKFFRRINNPVFSSRFLSVTYKPLTKFRFSGEHQPSEVLFNKYYAALIKSWRKKASGNYPPNFPLKGWMEDFVKKNLPICRDYNILKKTFNLDQLERDFSQENHISKESYWLKYTNPIMMRFITEEFNYG